MRVTLSESYKNVSIKKNFLGTGSKYNDRQVNKLYTNSFYTAVLNQNLNFIFSLTLELLLKS